MGYRKHNRLSVQPLLGLATSSNKNVTSGLRLSNFGLGPAKITNTKMMLGGKQIGEFKQPNVDSFATLYPSGRTQPPWANILFSARTIKNSCSASMSSTHPITTSSPG